MNDLSRHPLMRRVTRRLGWKRQPRGLGAIAAVIVLVVLSCLAAAIVRLGWTEQITFAQDIDSARGNQAAYAGVQWGLYQVFKGSWSACAAPTQTIDLRTQTGFIVTVTCSYTDYSEGESSEGVAKTVRLFTVEGTACNGLSACPDLTRVASPAYVERRRRVQVTN